MRLTLSLLVHSGAAEKGQIIKDDIELQKQVNNENYYCFDNKSM